MTSTRHRSAPALSPGPGDLADAPVEREDLRRRVSAALDAVQVAPPADRVLGELAVAATARHC